MAKSVFSESAHDTLFGSSLIAGFKEALAWKRGEIALPAVEIPALTAARVKSIRKAVAKSPREFSQRFGIPARTLEGWEQGRRQPDVTASVLLRVIERNPGAVEEALENDPRFLKLSEEARGDLRAGPGVRLEDAGLDG